MKVFVIILNWNRPKDTLACLESIKKIKPIGYELKLIIVDNASSDNSVELIKNDIKGDLNYSLIVNRENLGFAGGNNVGLKDALDKGADYLMVLNNDTLVHPNLINSLLTVFKEKERVGVVAPKIYFANGFEFHKDRYQTKDLGKVIWYAGGKIDWNNLYGKNDGVDEVDGGQFDKVKETDFATGSCSLYKAEALKTVGFFDERYFMYFEDTDLSIRLKKAGFGVYYTGRAYLWHKVAQSSGIGSQLNDYFITRNRLLFGFKYAKPRTLFALFRESLRLLVKGRLWQKQGIRDYYLGRFGKGSWV